MKPATALLSLAIASVLASGNVYAQDAPPAAPEATAKPFFNWVGNSLTLLHGWGFEVDPDEQTTVTFEHAHDSRIGDFFMFVDATRFHGVPDDADENTWYGELSPRLSLGKTLGKDLSFGFFKDTLVAGTYERGEDADVAEAVLLGVGFDLDASAAGFRYMQLNVFGRNELTETARSGFRDAQVTMVAARPFSVGKAQFLADGYFDWVLGLGSETWSYHLNPQVSLDVGNSWDKPGKLYAGLELDFWWNKYQIPDSAAFDTNQAAVSLMVKYHF